MALYQYKAIDSFGKRLSGMQDAANPVDLELRLRRVGLDLVTAAPAKQGARAAGGKILRPELITFFFNLEQLTRAGVPLLDSLADLRDTMVEPRFRQIIANMIENIEGGKSFSQAMSENPHAFDTVYVSLVRAGEQSGRLSEVFAHITESLKWQDELSSQTSQLLLYPSMVLLVVIGVMFFLMTYLVPQLAGFIKNIGQGIPPQTRALLALSDFFVNYWYLILFGPIAIVVGLLFAARTVPGIQYKLDDLKLKLALVGPIYRKIILARFAKTFALMYSSGISILSCVATCRDITGNLVIGRNLEEVGRKIEEGKNLTQSFQETGIFPPLVVRMLRVGESTGGLDQALMNVAYFYDRDVKESVKKLQTMIGPMLTVVMGSMLGWVMYAVLMPIYDVISKVKF